MKVDKDLDNWCWLLILWLLEVLGVSQEPQIHFNASIQEAYFKRVAVGKKCRLMLCMT